MRSHRFGCRVVGARPAASHTSTAFIVPPNLSSLTAPNLVSASPTRSSGTANSNTFCSRETSEGRLKEPLQECEFDLGLAVISPTSMPADTLDGFEVAVVLMEPWTRSGSGCSIYCHDAQHMFLSTHNRSSSAAMKINRLLVETLAQRKSYEEQAFDTSIELAFLSGGA